MPQCAEDAPSCVHGDTDDEQSEAPVGERNDTCGEDRRAIDVVPFLQFLEGCDGLLRLR